MKEKKIMKEKIIFKVRFNLGRGVNYRKWKIVGSDGSIKMLDSNKIDLHLNKCKLINKKSIAKKIFKGANKNVCAWIECESYSYKKNTEDVDLSKKTIIEYNPRKNPFWIMLGQDVDGQYFEKLSTIRNIVLV